MAALLQIASVTSLAVHLPLRRYCSTSAIPVSVIKISRSVRISHFETSARTFRCVWSGNLDEGMIHFEGILLCVDLRFVAAMSDQEGDMVWMRKGG